MISKCEICGRWGEMANHYWGGEVAHHELMCQNGEGNDCYMWVIRCLIDELRERNEPLPNLREMG